MSKATAAANVILNYHVRGTTPSALTPYLALLTAVETPAEPSGNNYARVQMTTSNFGNAASGGSIANTAAIAFPQASGSWGTVIGIAVYDASTSGNLVRKAYLTNGTYRIFTGLASTNILTAPGHSFVNGDRVVVNAAPNTSLPSSLVAGTLYHVVGVGTDVLQVSLTGGGSAVSLGSNGAGRVFKVVSQAVTTDFVPTFATGSLVFTEF